MSDTMRLLDDTLERMFTRHLSSPAARAAPGLAQDLLAEISEIGLSLVLLPEDQGGLGGTLADAATAAWRCGWHAAPVPVVETLLLPFLDPDADPFVTALAHGDPATAHVTDRTQTIRINDQTVPVDAASALRPLSRTQWRVVEGQSAAPDGTIDAMGALLCAAMMAGAMARVMEITVDYANTRTQFGRPLTKFQAIQHRLAEVASELAITEAALAGAIEAQDEGRGRALLWRAAKAQAGHAATVIAASAHQVLGAIGFTEEHELHHFTRRLWQWRDDWGRQADCEQAIGREACAAPDGLWPHIADETRKTA